MPYAISRFRVRLVRILFLTIASSPLLLTSILCADCVLPPAGLVAWWPGNGNANDSAGANPGTLSGSASYAPGNVGQAFVFPARGDSVVMPDSPALELGGQFTIEAWVNTATLTDDNGGGRAVVSKVGGSGGNNGYQFGFTAAFTKLFAQFNTATQGWPGNQMIVSLPSAVSTGVWMHVAWTYDQSAMKLYFNGQPIGTNVIGPRVIATSSSNLRISGDDNGNVYFNGLIDEVSIYTNALNAADILALYTASGAGKCGASSSGAAVPYAADFEKGISLEWAVPLLNSAETLGFSSFSGRFGNSVQSLTLTNLVPGQSYTLGFDFYAIDTWDGGTSDYFNVAVNGRQVFHETFANYNGEPPNSAQTYSGRPDEGRANYGFAPSYVDAIYRNLEITFTASNAVTTLSFSGQNLQDISDESWGVDNVSVQLASTLTNTFVRSTTLSPAGTTNSVAIENFTISANWPLAATATNAANFVLRNAGADGILGNGDDTIYTLTPSRPGAGSRSVAFAIANPPLQPGLYRFQTTAGLQGTNGVSLPVFTRDFAIANPVLGRIESSSNDTLANATPLPVAESPLGSGFYTAYGFGTFGSTSDVDYWSFNAEAGDVLSVRLEAESQGVSPQLYLQNSSGGNVATYGGDASGVVGFQNLTIGTPGTYYLRVWSSNNRSRYALRLDLSRSGPQLESEGNDTQAAANQINLNFSPGVEQGRIAGAIPAADTAGDFFRLGTFNPGNVISATTLYPAGALLNASQTILSVQIAGNATPLTVVTNSTLSFNASSNGVHYLRVETLNRNLRAQYLLTVNVADTVPPQITDASLPAEGSTTTAIVDRFTLNFSEDVLSTTLSNTANYELRCAGPNGAMGDADDVLYHVAPSAAYTAGLTESYTILDGPLQTGIYRFTVGTGLQDRAFNSLAAPFMRNFTVGNVPGYVLENRNNDVLGLGTWLGSSLSTNGNGTVAWINNVGTPSNPEGIVAGRFNADTNLDVATANWGGDNVTIYTNNGGGIFTAAASIGTGDRPIGVATADFNADGKADLAVANYGSSTVSILNGDGNAGFVLTTNLTGFSNPYGVVVADVNNDSKADVVVPNYGNGTVSVVLGNGDGTFQTRSNYTAGSNPAGVAVGDLNSDGKPDLAVANYSSATVSVFTNAGGGAFLLAATVPCGPNPRAVAIADVTGDGQADLVTVNAGDNSISVMAGNGDATFQARKFYYGGFTNPYQLALADLNGDGKRDVIIPGYGNNTFSIFLNDGAGGFTNWYSYGTSGNPIGVAVGDFSNDGRPDLAFCHYYGNVVSLWLGNAPNPLAEDPPGSGLRAAFGRGARSNSGDMDFWQFTAQAGDQCIVAVDTVGNPGNSQLYFQLQGPDGGVYTWWYAANNGWGQSGVVSLPQNGTYFVRVAASQDYQGEYRLRVTLARPPLQLSNESNTSIGSARAVGLTPTNNYHLAAAIAGYLSAGDGQDYYSLGNLLGGTTISLNFRGPASSGLAEIVWIYNSAGTIVTNSRPGVTNFTFTVPAGSNGVYYVGLSAAQATYSPGPSTAIGFNGSSSYVDLGAWTAGTQWTLQAWANPSSLPGGRRAVVGATAQCLDWGIVLQDGQFAVNLTPPGSCNTQYRSGDPVTPGQWYQLTATCDGTNASLYINGQLRISGPSATYTGTAQGTRLGGDTCCSDYFPGLINDVRIWNRPLSAGEIAANIYTPLSGSEPNLLGYWRCNEGFGPTTADLSTFNRTGTLAGGASWVNLGPTNATPPSLRCQYILGFDLTNPAPPAITGVTLPANNSTNAGLISSFSVSFNEDLDPRFVWLARNISRTNGHSYLLTDAASDWQTTEAAAAALGGHLATINSAAENSFLNQTFSSAGTLWIGLNHFASGAWSWSSGEPVTYLNWTGGQPDNGGGYEFTARLRTDGAWEDTSYGTSLWGIIEVTSIADADGDGLVDSLDPYPNDPLNAFDLRAAGPDGLFDTADDVPYRLYSTGYSSGLSSGFAIADGPLQPGNYRFKVTTALRDRFGNTLPSAFTQYFTIAPVAGFVEENRRTNGVSVTSLSLNISNRIDGSFGWGGSIATGVNPHFMTQGYLNSDTNLDLVTCNISSDNITVYLGDGTGSFQAVTNISTGDGPISAVIADFNGDSKMDLAVANYYADTVTILLGDGNGGFQVRTNYSGFSNPINLAAADFNQDNKLDLAVPNYGSTTVRVLLGNGDGTFLATTNYTVGSKPETVAVGDLNGDGQPDLVVANYGSSFLSVLLGNTNGTFQTAVNYTNAGGGRYATLGDVNGDGRLDIVAISDSTLSVFFGNGDGTFQARTDYSVGGGNPYQVVLADLNSDGALDAVVAGYGANRLDTILNNGDGTFGGQFTYNPGGNPISVTAGDYNHDGRLDLATATYNGNYIQVLLGNNTESLAYDPAGTGLRIAAGRGNLADSSDLGYWTFSALASDRLFIATENPGNPGGSQLLFRIYYPDGSQWTYFYPDYYGRGQISLVVPASGTYTIRVEPNYQYYGEYRLRVTLGRPPLQLEGEDNGSLDNANALAFSITNGVQRASVLGYLGSADGSDIFRLGNLAAGTLIRLGLAEPATSGLLDELVIRNSAGAVAAYSSAGATNLSYLVPPGSNGTYYAQVWDAGPASALNFGGANSNNFALRFDGGSTWIEFTNAVIPASGDFTVEAWAYANGLDGYRDILSQGSGGNAFYLGYRSGMARAGDGWEYIGSVPWPQNAWHHFAVVKSSTNTLLYIDGALAASKGGTIPNPASSTPLRFGRQYGGNGEYWAGDIDEVRIWNVARSASDLQLNLSNRLAGTESGLIGYWRLDEGANNVVFDATTNGFNGTFQNYPVWVPCGRTNPQPSSIFSQYVLSLELTNTQPPMIVSDSLPAQGSTNAIIIDRFSLNFSQDMGASTVNDPASYELLCAGPDNTFGNSDDILYSIANSPAYVSGTSASYFINDGPLQPGLYRFTARTTITDPLGSPIAAPYVRNFALTNVAGFFLESRDNNSFATATSLSFAPTNRPDGSFSGGPGVGLPSNPERLAAGRLNGDTNMDLVVCQWNYPGVTVLTGNGDGSFTVKTNYTTGSGAWSLALGYFNSDTNLDLAVANYDANTITVFTGTGDGAFQVRSNYAVGVHPYHLVTGDFNNDGKTDLAVPILNSGNVSILLGNGDGSFQPPVNYASGSGPVYAAVGDVNRDGKQDLVVANYYADTVSLFLGNGNGTFATAVTLATGHTPHSVLLRDLNGDGKLDLAVFNGGDNTVSVMFGNGDGSFQPRVNYGAGTSEGYELLAADVNGDGWPDLVVGGYYNSVIVVFPNHGDGTFDSPTVYSMGSRIVGLAAADFNNDGRMDIAAASDSGNAVWTLLGNNTEPVAADGLLRTTAGRGNLASGDVDYWSFTGQAGDILDVAAQNPGDPNSSGLLYRIYYPNGSQWTYFYTDGNGRGQMGATLPVGGTYYIRVEQNYGYIGEYRFRVTLARPPVQVETEPNDNTSQANALTFANQAGHQTASVLGYIGSADGSGDFFRLGSLSAGAAITLGLWQPPSSGFADVLEVYSPAGSLVASSLIGATNLNYTVPVAGAGDYFAHVRAAYGLLPPVPPHPTGSTNTLFYRPNGYSEVVIDIPETALAVSFWFRTADPNAGLFSVDGGGHDRHVYLNGGNISARLYNNQTISSSGLALADGNWHYVVYTHGSAISGQMIYVDGVQVAYGTKATSDFTWQSNLHIGYSEDAPDPFLSGNLDEVRLWNYAFGPADVLSNMTNSLTGSEAGLIGYWRFNEGTGTVSLDRTTNAHNATLINGPTWSPAVTTGVKVMPGLFAQYVLSLDTADAVGPAITSATLPANGTTTTGILDRFTLNFSKDPDPAINNLNRYIRAYNGHGYTITDAGSTWYTAEQQAQVFGGHLVAINDSLENAFVYGAFSGFVNFWIGLSDEAQHGTYVWSSGDPFAYTNWDSGQPNNANNQDYGVMRGGGVWADYAASANFRGVVEVAGPDSDGDGIPDALDPYRYDPYNGVDLRAAGLDGLFDTPDDAVYRLTHDTYSSGTSLGFYLADGPLQPGNYRLMVTGSLVDRFGNSATPFVEHFTISGVPGYVNAGRTNSSSSAATALALIEDPAGLKSAGARGKLFDSNDQDWWSFTATNGDWLRLSTEAPGDPYAARLRYRVYAPGGSLIVDLISDYSTSLGQSVPLVLATNGTFLVQVTPYDGYYSEYRFRIATVQQPRQFESEDNGSLAAATPLTLVSNGNSQSVSVAGYVRSPGDLDYFNLGTVSNGSSIFLNVRQPSSSPLVPIVSVYNAANAYQSEAPGGRADDGVAEVRVTQTGTYYALVRGSLGSGGLDAQYLLDAQVLPTGTVLFPNLQVTAITLPTGAGLQSGQPINYAFTVGNVGSTNTIVANWIDRAVLSTDTVLGNADDIPLGFFPRAGALDAGQSYTVTNAFMLPDGLSGDFYMIAQTDAGNAVNEFLFEGDNTTVSSGTFHVNLAPYADVRVENLTVSGPDVNNVYTITWNTANRGNGPAPPGFYERITVRNITSGALLLNLDQAIGTTLATNGVLPHVQTVAATNAGTYLISVLTDSHNDLWEFDGISHATAEANNGATTNFAITAYYTVALSSSPPGAGVLAGAGTYGSGSPVTVTATPNTNVLPYFFVNWTEGGAFQSATTNYAFNIAGNRALVANFSLPAFLLSASNSPPYAGTVSGQGSYFYGTTNILTANPATGYRFTNWTESGSVLSTSPSLSVIVRSNRFVVANYVEANTTHYVTTGTSPTNLAVVAGAGTFTNGASTTITAPVGVTNPPSRYAFREFRLNGSLAGGSASFSKTFSTLDPTNMQYVAFYDTFSILPTITQVIAGVTNPILGGFNIVTNPVGAIANWQLTLTFDRTMNTSTPPAILITNSVAPVQPFVPTNGTWSTTVVSNDTYRTPFITFSNGMDGPATVRVSGALDLSGLPLPATNVASLVIDVTPPQNPTLTLTASNSSSATVSWASYVLPPDLGTFRVYLGTNNFSSLAGLAPLTTLNSSWRSWTYSGLALDTPYWAAVAAVDNAGNGASTVTPLAFTLPSATPPPVPVRVTAPGPSSAQVSWNSYDTTYLLGFAGFRLYYASSNFSSVAGLTPAQTLGAGARSVQIDGLDRTRTWYFAVVGYNVNNAYNPAVTTASWSDPLAGNVGANLTIGGAGQPVVDVLQSMTVVSNATITIPPGTTLRFAPGTAFTIQQGQLNANGTPLDPIVFTSANDQPGLTPGAGDWAGVTLGSGAGNSLLRHVFVKYAAGLTASNCAPTVDAFTALYNTNAGLILRGTASLTTSNALLALNDIGARQLGAAAFVIVNSDLKNNGTNTIATGGGSVVATQNWWGSAVAGNVAASVQGAVTTTGFLTSEPVLTPAVGTVGNVTQVGVQSVNLRLACRTADSMRLSEDSTFTGVFFSPFTNQTAFPLSAGGGLKTVFAQFRSVTGQTNPPVSITVNYITAGPTISAFNLTEGQTLNRPVVVTGSAYAPLGMADMEFYVDGVGQGTNVGGSFSQWFDVRNFSSAIHRVELVARDAVGNFSTLDHNVVILPTPPTAPVITQPAADLATNGTTISISGTAEPLVALRLVRSGTILVTTNAAANGTFSFPNVALVEGANPFTVVAYDALGSGVSATRNVSRDTVPPTALVFDTPTYTPGLGLRLTWHYPSTGKHATTFQVFWSTGLITNVSQAIGQSLPRLTMIYTVQGLPTGNYYFYVVGYDDTGNVSPLSNPLPYYFDAVPPAFGISFDKASPVGVGLVQVTLTSSKPLMVLPTLTVQPAGNPPSLLPVTNAALNTYQGVVNVTPFLPSGAAQFAVSGQDLAGNTFNGPVGALTIDTTPPSGDITTVPGAPVQTTNSPIVAVNLQLSEAAKPGTTPTVNFNPPIGAGVPVALTGAGTSWHGTVQLTPAMGSGLGHFTLTANDALDNVGHNLTSGSTLEIYNTALPSPPGKPVAFLASSLSGGRVTLTWLPVTNAEIYRVYSDPGTNQFDTPTTLIADNVVTNRYVDLPPADGYYEYSVTAVRRGAEGSNSITRVALSDRTPPSAPTNVALQLVASGLQITWQAAAGGTFPDHYNVYRNGTRITTVGYVTPVLDSPPRGIMSYTVAASDALGNEAVSDPATIQLLVGAVNNLQAIVDVGAAPVLNWTSGDPTAVGFNVYRNGIKQNSARLTAPTFSDTLPPSGQTASYAVTALNATNAESVARTVTVYPVDLGLQLNLNASGQNPPVTTYFDDCQVTLSNLTASGALPLQQLQVQRYSGGVPLTVSAAVNGPVPAGGSLTRDLIVPGATTAAAQWARVLAVQQTDSEGSGVTYQKVFNLPAVTTPGVMLAVSANQLPLAGGLNSFNVQVYNRGYVPMYFATVRGGGSQPGDLYISVLNPQNQEVGRTPFKGTVPGEVYDAGGTGYALVPPGSSTTITVPGVLVPAALASNTVTFQAVVSAIYDRVTSEQQQSGPLAGSTQSGLAQTPYYATAQTDHAEYYNDQPIIISGQALDRVTGLPVPNVPLKLGFATRGYKWYVNLTNDVSGNYTYNYQPMPGLAGSLTIWAAHPDIFDQLNQAQVTIYRFYASPATGDIRMSKNDTLDFSLQLINPSDQPLTGFTVSVAAYTMVGTNQVPTTKLHGYSLMDTNFMAGPNQRPTMNLRLAADADAPDTTVVVFTITSAEGASATFTGNVLLLPANPLITVVRPTVGYLEVSLNRGALLSGQLTFANHGLRDLQGVTLVPPTNVTWMIVNLATNAEGTIPLPDLPVGGSNTITVVFAPPTNTALGFFQDKITVRGTNAVATFDLGVYARVTSANRGGVQFYVDDILGLPVPGASVRLQNVDLQVELPPARTDINGYVTVTNLQEGNWSWQVGAPGHAARVGSVTVIASQTVQVAPPDTRLSRSLVTVNFTVVPVPFTDKYDIQIEQTFETHVPAPVLVLDPTYLKFDNIQGAFEANFTVTAKNYGLISLNNVKFSGSDVSGGRLTPLIEYLPYILPMQSVEIPFRVTYDPAIGGHQSQQAMAGRQSNPCEDGTAGGFLDCVSGNWLNTACGVMNILGLAQGDYHCAADAALLGVAAGLMVLLNFYYAVLSPFDVVVSAFGCLVQFIAGLFAHASDSGGGGGAPNGTYSGYGNDFGGCFAAETRVLLEDGRFKTIDQIKPGDRVRTGSGRVSSAAVTETHERMAEKTREIRYALPGSQKTESLRTTDEHFFWVDGKGWTEAQKLQPGQWLFDEQGRRLEIVGNRSLGQPLKVYTFRLHEDAVFYANNVLVHDLCGQWTTNGPAPVRWPMPPDRLSTPPAK